MVTAMSSHFGFTPAPEKEKNRNIFSISVSVCCLANYVATWQEFLSTWAAPPAATQKVNT